MWWWRWCNATICQSISVLVSSGGRLHCTVWHLPPPHHHGHLNTIQSVSRISIFPMFCDRHLTPVTALLVPPHSQPWHACSSWVWGESAAHHLPPANWSEFGWVDNFLQMPAPAPPAPPAPQLTGPHLCPTWGGRPGPARGPGWPWWPLSVQCSVHWDELPDKNINIDFTFYLPVTSPVLPLTKEAKKKPFLNTSECLLVSPCVWLTDWLTVSDGKQWKLPYRGQQRGDPGQQAGGGRQQAGQTALSQGGEPHARDRHHQERNSVSQLHGRDGEGGGQQCRGWDCLSVSHLRSHCPPAFSAIIYSCEKYQISAPSALECTGVHGITAVTPRPRLSCPVQSQLACKACQCPCCPCCASSAPVTLKCLYLLVQLNSLSLSTKAFIKFFLKSISLKLVSGSHSCRKLYTIILRQSWQSPSIEIRHPNAATAKAKDDCLDISEEFLSQRSSISCHRGSLHSLGDIEEPGDLNRENVEKYELEVFEPETPGRGVSSVFICLYSVLGNRN